MTIKNGWLINKMTESLNRSLHQLNNEYSDKITSGITLDKNNIEYRLIELLREKSTSNEVLLQEVEEMIIYLSLVYLHGVNRN